MRDPTHIASPPSDLPVAPAQVDGEPSAADQAPVAPARRTRHPHRLALLVIVLAGFVRGMFWVVSTEVWNPIDETRHFGYVASIATGHGIPTVGKDLVPEEVARSEKRSATLGYDAVPRVVTDDSYWRFERQQYEGVQPPLYYAALAPVYLVAHPLGTAATLFALRTATLLLALTGLPLLYLLSRAMFPEDRTVWLLAPVVLLAVESFSASLASVSNDAAVVPISLLATLLLVRLTDAPSVRRAVPVGLALGGAVLVKPTTVGLVPFLGVYLVARAVRDDRLRTLAVTVPAIGLAAAAVVVPWLAWNQATYGNWTANEAATVITGHLQYHAPLSVATLRTHWQVARDTVWSFELRATSDTLYRNLLHAFLIAGLIAAVAGAARRRQWSRLIDVLWLGTAIPLAVIGMELMIFGAFGGSGLPLGRYLLGGVGPACLVIAVGARELAGIRWSVPLALGLVAVTTAAMIPVERGYLDDIYTAGVLPGHLAPVVNQPRSEGGVNGGVIEVQAPCEGPLVAIHVERPPDTPPPDATVTTAGGTGVVPGAAIPRVHRESDPLLALYQVPTGASSARLVLPQTAQLGRSTVIDRRLLYTSGDASPTGRIYCPRADAADIRYAQLFAAERPLKLSRRVAHSWYVDQALAWLAAVVFATLWAAKLPSPAASAADESPEPAQRL